MQLEILRTPNRVLPKKDDQGNLIEQDMTPKWYKHDKYHSSINDAINELLNMKEIQLCESEVKHSLIEAIRILSLLKESLIKNAKK